MNLLERFKQSLETQKLFRPGGKVYVACSGGPDSVSLYFLLKKTLSPGIRLGLIHFNHRLRGKASDADERFVLSLARREKAPVIIGRAEKTGKEQTGKSPEESARHERYAFFEQAFQKHQILKIATAHTLDDQAETVLMRVLQGTGPQGLAGIRRSFKYGRACFVRPLLDFSKEELLCFLRAEKIEFRKDLSNQSLRFLRNRIRHSLLPQLAREFNPRVRQALARLPVILEEENEMLETLKAQAWKQCFKRKGKQAVNLKRKKFRGLPGYLQFSVLDKALKTLDPLSGLSFEAWQKLKFRLGDASFRHSLPKEVDLELSPLTVNLYKRTPLKRKRLPNQSGE